MKLILIQVIRHIIIGLLLLLPLRAFTQVIQNYCGSNDEAILLGNESYHSSNGVLQQSYKDYLQSSQRQSSSLTIPVVFHVIHNNGLEALSDDRVMTALNNLNDAFANAGGFYDEDGVETGIQFCLAKRDQEGNAFDGINRVETMYTDMSLFDGWSFVQAQQFDPSQYLNIQIVKEVCLGTNCDVAGYFGGTRVVVNAEDVGIDRDNSTLLIHEVGHALGLMHTWRQGCKNDDCQINGDWVCDTPPDNRTFDLCHIPSNSCSSDEDDQSLNNPFRPSNLGGLGDQPDDHANYMDYNWRHCRTHFTEGQAARMHFTIQQRYGSLLTSQVCLPPCEAPVIAGFTLSDTIVAIGTQLTLTNTSINANDYVWTVDGDTSSTDTDLVLTVDQEGISTIELEAYTNDTLCQSESYLQEVQVICPIDLCIYTTLEGQILSFEDCSTDNLYSDWSILDHSGDTILVSDQSMDSVYVNNLPFVEVCLTTSNDFCHRSKCQLINIQTDGSELCGNDEDDDGDGLIDLFDPDCPCDDEVYQAMCPVECEIIPDSFADIKMKMKWQTEVFENCTSCVSTFKVFTDLDSSFIITNSYFVSGVFPWETLDSTSLMLFDATSGSLLKNRKLSNFFFPIREFAVARSSGNSEIKIYFTQGERLNIFSSSLDSITVSDEHLTLVDSPVFTTDLNSDGNFEVVVDTKVYNGLTGQSILEIPGFGSNIWDRLSIPAIADFLPTPGLEIAGGTKLLSLNITNQTGEIGNSYTEIQFSGSNQIDGFTSYGDIDQDGWLDVIVVGESENADGGGILVWNPYHDKLISYNSAGLNGGGVAFCGDVDGDCAPEIGVTFKEELRVYKYNGSTSMDLLWSIPTSDQSGFTGVTMFDFNQDGMQELVYRDETRLMILNGENGTIIDEFPVLHITGTEMPIIADIDHDGQAEILVTGHESNRALTRIMCFESAGAPWAPARSVWNQYAYNPTQVNDDLTIPRFVQNPAQPLQGTENCPRETCNTPYNNFMTQATYRTQEGCYVWPALESDLTIDANSRCLGDSLEICFYASATDTITLPGGVTVSCYPPPWDEDNPATGEAIDQIVITSDSTCFVFPQFIGIDSILVVINDEVGIFPFSLPNSDIQECDYSNNSVVVDLRGPDLTLDVIDYTCSLDSLTFSLVTNNVGSSLDYECLQVGYGVTPPSDSSWPLEEVTVCYSLADDGETYQYLDTLEVTIPKPLDQGQVWWTINEGGFGPGITSADITGIFECNYTNNMDNIVINISPRVLDLGIDIVKCETEVVSLSAGGGFETYLWTDLTTDSLYSTTAAGLHSVEAFDACGRRYTDTIEITISEPSQIDLGGPIMLCSTQTDTMITVSGEYDAIQWLPLDAVDCDTCQSTLVSILDSLDLVVMGRLGDCVTFDTLSIQRIVPVEELLETTACQGDTLLFEDTQVTTSGSYVSLSTDCTILRQLDVEFFQLDTLLNTLQLCSPDSVFFDGSYLKASGQYIQTLSNINGCDSTIMLDLMIAESYTSSDTFTICENDSIQINTEWIKTDTLIKHSYLTVNGCDSLVNYRVIATDLPRMDLSEAFCEGDSLLYYDQWYFESGLFEIQIPTVSGCDSIVTLAIETYPEYVVDELISVCLEDSVLVNQVWIYGDTSLVDLKTTAFGCDSTTIINVTTEKPPTDQRELILCIGDSLFLYNQWYNEEGIYEIRTQSEGLCDSIITIQIDLQPTFEIYDTFHACIGDTLIMDDGALFSQTGNHINYLETQMSCDSTIYTHLYFDAIYFDSEEYFLCPGDSIFIDERWIFDSDTLMMETLSSEGCDSIQNIEIVVFEVGDNIPDLPDTLINKDEIYSMDLQLVNASDWQILWQPATSVNCDTCHQVQITATELTQFTVQYLHIETGCEFTDQFNVDIVKNEGVEQSDNSIFIPNVFRPGQGDLNGLWSVYTSDSNTIENCQIYDRWGNLVYSIQLSNISWDGTLNGNYCEQGVYVYLIEYRDESGTINKLIGDVTLIR